MNPILTPVLLVVALGFVFAVILTIAAKVFFVPVDETVVKLREALPARTAAAADSRAAMITRQLWRLIRKALARTNVRSAARIARRLWAAILGIEAGSAEPQVATVMCNGNKQAAKSLLSMKAFRPAARHQICLAA